MKRKILACVLALCMLLTSMACALTVFADAADLIEYGSYPSSQVTERTLVWRLGRVSKSWRSYGYYSGTGTLNDGKMTAGDFMQYADFTYDGVKYRAVKINSNRPSATSLTSGTSTQKTNGYSKGTYYFKYEPIVWRVLDSHSGLVVSEKILDSQAFQNVVSGSGANANDYANSSIRKWLASEFANTAFTSAERAKIKTASISTETYDAATGQYDTGSVEDSIFLLSTHEAEDKNYGFVDSTAADASRTATGTAYAKAQGLWTWTGDRAFWWLRTPGETGIDASYVTNTGAVDTSHAVGYTDTGVRPAMYLDNDTDHLMHKWDDVETVKEATCTEDGELLVTCTVCGAKKNETVPAL